MNNSTTTAATYTSNTTPNITEPEETQENKKNELLDPEQIYRIHGYSIQKDEEDENQKKKYHSLHSLTFKKLTSPIVEFEEVIPVRLERRKYDSFVALNRDANRIGVYQSTVHNDITHINDRKIRQFSNEKKANMREISGLNPIMELFGVLGLTPFVHAAIKEKKKGGGDYYHLAGYDLLTEGDDFVMYRHRGSGRTFRVWKSVMPSREGTRAGTSGRDDNNKNNNNSQIDNNLNKAMSTVPSDQQSEQHYNGSYIEFVREKQKAAKAAYLQMRHDLIERALLERKRDIESRTVTLKDGRRVVLPRRSNDAVINMIAESSKYDRE